MDTKKHKIIEKLMQDKEYDKAADYVTKELNIILTSKYLKSVNNNIAQNWLNDLYNVTLEVNSRKFTFEFTQSIKLSGEFKCVGNKIYCTNNLGKCNFTKEEYVKLGSWNQKEYSISENLNFEIPSMYSVLCCITKDDIGTLANFCSDFGYNEDSIKANKIYANVKEEYLEVSRLFNEKDLDLLRILH